METTQSKFVKRWQKESWQLFSRHSMKIIFSWKDAYLNQIWSHQDQQMLREAKLHHKKSDTEQLWLLVEQSHLPLLVSLSFQEVNLKKKLLLIWMLWINWLQSENHGLLHSHMEELYKIQLLKLGLVNKKIGKPLNKPSWLEQRQIVKPN